MAFTPLILLSTVAAGVPSKETILDTAGPLLWAYYIPSSPSPTSFNRSYIDLFYIPPLRVVPTRPWISPLGLVLHHHHHSGSRCSPARVAPEIWPDRAVFFFFFSPGSGEAFHRGRPGAENPTNYPKPDMAQGQEVDDASYTGRSQKGVLLAG